MADGITLTSGIRAESVQPSRELRTFWNKRKPVWRRGKKVQSALDDPINFFAAQGHQQRANDLSSRKDEMG